MSTNENKGKKAEVTALQAISAEDRKDWISLAFVQAGICVCVPAFLLGALLAEAMPIWPAIISGSLGYLNNCWPYVYAFLHSYWERY